MLSQRLISLEIGESLIFKSTQDWLAYNSQSGKQAWLSASTGEIAFGKAPPSTMTEKEFSPRNLRKAGVPVRTLEDGFLLNLQNVYKTAASEVALHVEDTTKLGEIITKLREELEDETDKYVWKIYTAGVASESPGDTPVPLDGSDIRATQWVWNNKNGLGQAIKGFAAKQLRSIQKAMERHIAAGQPFDLPVLVKMLRPIVVKGRNDLERIARTESSRIVNVSRAMTWEKIADPTKEEFHWIVANHPRGDKRTCEICLTIAKGGTVLFDNAMTEFPGNPYNLGSLKRLVPHLIAHPNERCVIVRKPERILGKSWKLGPFAGPNGGEYWLTDGPELVESAWTKEYRPIKEKSVVIAKYKVYKEPKDKAGWKGPIRGPKGGTYWERQYGQDWRRQEVEPAWTPEDVVLDGSREHEWEGENLRSGRIQFKGEEAGDYSYVFQAENVSSLTDPPTHVYIGVIKIHHAFRQRGIGTEILKRIENEAMERGLSEIRSQASWDGTVVWPLLGFEWGEKEKIVEFLQAYSDKYGLFWDEHLDPKKSSKEIVLSNPAIARALIEMGWGQGGAAEFYNEWVAEAQPERGLSPRDIGFYITKHLWPQEHLKSKADLPEWAQAIIDRDLWFAEEEELTEKIWVPMKQMPADWRGPMRGKRGGKYMISPKGEKVYNPSKWPKKIVMGWLDSDTGNFVPGKEKPGLRAGPSYQPDVSERRREIDEIKDVGLKQHLEIRNTPGIYNPKNDRVWMYELATVHDDIYQNFTDRKVGWGPNLHYFVIPVGGAHPLWGELSRRQIDASAVREGLEPGKDLIVAFDAGPSGGEGQYTWEHMFDAFEAMRKEFPELTGFAYQDKAKGWQTVSLKKKEVLLASYRETIKFPLLEKGWTRYRGPKGGKGWKSDVTGVVLYQDEKPGEDTGHFEGIFEAPDQAIAAAEKFGPGTKITKTPQGYKVERGQPQPKKDQRTLEGRPTSEVYFPSKRPKIQGGETFLPSERGELGEQQTLEGEGIGGRALKMVKELQGMISDALDLEERIGGWQDFQVCYDDMGLWRALGECIDEKKGKEIRMKFVDTLVAYGMNAKSADEFQMALSSWTGGQIQNLRDTVETGHDYHMVNKREDLKRLQKFYQDYEGEYMADKRLLYRGMGLDEEDWVKRLKVGDSAKILMNAADSWTEDGMGDTADDFARTKASGSGRFPNGVVLEAEMPREDILIGYPFVGFGKEEENIVLARDYDWKVKSIDYRGSDWGDTEELGDPAVITLERQPLGGKANVAIFDLTGENDWAGTRRLVKKETLGTGTAGVVNPVYSKPKKRKKVKGKEADAGPSGGSAIKIVDYIKRAAEDWVPYKGPRGGTGFRNVKTGYIWYGDKPPSDKQHKTGLEARHRQNKRIGVLDRIGTIVPHMESGQTKGKMVKPLANILNISNNTKRAYSMLAFAERGGLISQDELDASAAQLGISERRRKRLEAKIDHDLKKYMPKFERTKTSPERILRDIKEQGGITINIGTGDRPTAGFAVADVPGAEKIYDSRRFSMKHIQAYLKAHPKLEKSKDLHFGAWKDEETGKIHLDTPRVYKSRDEAIAAGRKANQISIWDFEKGEEIRLKAEIHEPERKFGVTAEPYGQKSILITDYAEKQGGWRGPIKGPKGGEFMVRPDGTPEYDQTKWPQTAKPEQPTIDPKIQARAEKMKTKVPLDKRIKLLQMGVDRFPPMDATNIKVRLRFKPKKEPAMTWRDSKGRAQAAYTKVFLEANASKKWTRVMKYDSKLEYQQRRLQNLVGRTKFGTPENQAAVIASVISLTGLRVGGKTAAKNRHFGVSTLRGTHVKQLKNGGVALIFTGKSGVKINQHVPPGKTAKALLKYAKKAAHRPMFSIGPHKPRSLLPKGFKLKDFRTILATRWAKEELAKEFSEYIKHDYRWSKPEQIKKMIMAASKRVAKKLHNTPSVARGSYIHPEVIEEFIEKIND